MNTFTKRGLKIGLIVGCVSLIPSFLFIACGISSAGGMGFLLCLPLVVPMLLVGNQLISFLFPAISFQLENFYPIFNIANFVFNFVFYFGIIFLVFFLIGRIKTRLFYKKDLVALSVLFLIPIVIFLYKSTNSIDQWIDLGKPEEYSHEISGLVSWRGNLCVADSIAIRCYDGSKWSQLRKTKDYEEPLSLVVLNDQPCYYERHFDNTDLSSYSEVYCYDGSNWKSYGGGKGYFGLTVWNNRLCQQSEQDIRCYNGVSWDTVINKTADSYASWGDYLCLSKDGSVECYNGQIWNNLGKVTESDWNTSLFNWGNKLCTANYKDPNSYEPWGADNSNIKCFDGSAWEDLHWYGKTSSFGKVSFSQWGNQLCLGEDYGKINCYDGKEWKIRGATDDSIWGMGVWSGKLCIGTYSGEVRCLIGQEL